MKFDVLKDLSDFIESSELDWVTALPAYQHLYNTTYHKSIGKDIYTCCYNYPFTYCVTPISLNSLGTNFSLM